MTPSRPSSIPLPAAVLALSVAVCIGAAGPAGATPGVIETRAQAEQRDTLEHLLDAIQQAAKKLSDRLTGQTALAQRAITRPALALTQTTPLLADAKSPAIPSLREALLNLPPPAC